jgi:hypothetical protein
MPMTPQPYGVTRTPMGSERPARMHAIRHNGKFAGYTVRLEAGSDKWAALSPDGALVGETKTHNEALALLAPEAEAKPRKTSVYLDGATAADVRRSGLPLAELIRRGLAASMP